MSFDIHEKRFRHDAWNYCLDTAEVFGWQPAGTEAPTDYPEDGTWCGTYYSNDSQWVTDADAAGLAKALYAAVRAIEAGEIEGSNHDPGSLRDLADIAMRGGFSIR